MPLTTPLLPVLALLLGAIVLPLTKRLARPRARDGLALVGVGGSLLLLVSLYSSRPATVSIPLWRPASLFGTQLGYHVDNLSLLFASLMLLILLLVFLSQVSLVASQQESAYSYGGTFLVAAGGVSLVFASDLVTLYLSWGFLDLGLFVLTAFLHRGKAASRTGLRLLAVNYIAGLALLASLLLLERESGSLSLQATFLPSKVISLTLFAALARLGLYPALVVLPDDVEMSLAAVIAWYVIPLTAGGYLLSRVLVQGAVTAVWGREVALFLGSLALILSPFPLWFKGNLQSSASYIVLNQVGYLALAAAVAGASLVVVATTQVISTALALSLLFLSHVHSPNLATRRFRLWPQACASVGVATLVGAPFTVGWVSRWILYQSLWQSGLGVLVILGLCTNSFLLAPLLKLGVGRGPQSGGQGRRSTLFLGAMTAMAAPLVILGFHPPLMGPLAGTQSTLTPLPSVPDLFRSGEAVFGAIMTAGVLVSLGLGYLMYRRGKDIVAVAGVALETLRGVAEIGWMYRALSWMDGWLTLILERLGRFSEEGRSTGWILLFGLLMTLLLLST